MILSDAIIVGIDDVRILCEALERMVNNTKLRKLLSTEQLESYRKLSEIVIAVDERKRAVETMQDDIREIKRIIDSHQL
jgi:hypothetical protein